ncbi:MAG: MurR/RpiR family transcriptional regulator [Defluviitaleaceae bacterium]|nr:MurR/RpiR family transcriptional regulator [Defluviitaleaceae bacterium]
MLISERIKQNYAYLSNKQKKIADYLLEHDDEMGFKTLKNISSEVGVTEVTVINFCRALGFSNYMEMKLLYRNEVTERYSPTKKIFSSFFEDGEFSRLLPEVIEKQVQNHTRTLYRLDEESILKTVKLIGEARKVYIFCRGSTVSISSFFKCRLDSLAIDSEIVDISLLDNRFFMNSMRFTKNDVYIFMTYPVYSKVLLKFGEHFKTKGYNVVALTDKTDSPIAKYADICFFTDNDSYVFFNSFQSLVSVIEVIAILLHNSLKDRLLAQKGAVEEMEKEFESFALK